MLNRPGVSGREPTGSATPAERVPEMVSPSATFVHPSRPKEVPGYPTLPRDNRASGVSASPATDPGASYADPSGAAMLDPTELQMLDLIGAGTRDRKVCAALGIDQETALRMAHGLRGKLGLRAGASLRDAARGRR